MAAVVASPLLELVFNKLATKIWKEVGLLRDLDGKIEKLQSILSTIRDVLDDAEKRAVADKALHNWLKKLKDAAYDADDVVDEFEMEAMRRMMKSHDDLKGKVREFFSPRNLIVFRRKMGWKLKQVLKRLDEIAEERKNFHLTEGYVSERLEERQTHSDVVPFEVYGRDEDKEKVVNFLINEDNNKEISVLTIVGLGGLGKTALAQLAYNDERVSLLFDLQIWVCVSEDFDSKGIARAIIECVTKRRCDLLQIEPLRQLLRESLGGKRFLLILDDVWNEDGEKWESLKSLLRYGRLGSKIVVTTRSESVARVMGSVSLHRLKGLSADHCWILFRQRAFDHGREEETPRLVEIGKEIVSKCGGLPLAAKALGSLMGTRRGEAEWLDIRNSELWRLSENEFKVLPSLKLSYDHMPPHLKQCFAYCSLFHRDFEFDKDKLIRLWIAEGFVLSSDGGMSAEDVGNLYFNSLLWRSFFQDVAVNTYNRRVTCKMHDLVHDLARYVAGDEFSTLEIQECSRNFHACTRHLSVIRDRWSTVTFSPSCPTKKLRSLILSERDSNLPIQEVNLDALVGHRNLRVLDICNNVIFRFPSSVCKMEHLIFLDLSRSGITEIPDSIIGLRNLSTLNLAECRIEELPDTITTLPNLSTLNLWGCRELRELPNDISHMRNLRHLDIYGCTNLRHTPPGMGRLSSLRTMPLFIVHKRDGHSISELQQLNQIHGLLEIRKLHNVRNPTEAKEAKLEEKINVKQLRLVWEASHENAKDVFESLQPHPATEELNIEGYGGIGFPSWMPSAIETSSSPFPNLVHIGLSNLKGCDYLPALGQLPSLKRLFIHQMKALRRIGEELYGNAGRFPSLEDLTFSDMPNLEEWVEAAAGVERETMFPRLKSLRIAECPKLRVQPGLPVSVVRLQIAKSSEELLSARSLAGLCRVRELSLENIEALPQSSRWEGVQHLVALDKFELTRYKGLTCFPEGVIQLRIPSVRTLEISWNMNLRFLAGGETLQPPLLYSSIQHLTIRGSSELEALPEWLGGLTSLRSLEISYCDSLTMLPDGLQRLTALRHLQIRCCRLLASRCEREVGDDWHKISHIPDVQIFT